MQYLICDVDKCAYRVMSDHAKAIETSGIDVYESKMPALA